MRPGFPRAEMRPHAPLTWLKGRPELFPPILRTLPIHASMSCKFSGQNASFDVSLPASCHGCAQQRTAAAAARVLRQQQLVVAKLRILGLRGP